MPALQPNYRQIVQPSALDLLAQARGMFPEGITAGVEVSMPASQQLANGLDLFANTLVEGQQAFVAWGG
jgi:hypothetical protein